MPYDRMTVPYKDRVGFKVNMLTIIAVVGDNAIVKCDCGSTIDVKIKKILLKPEQAKYSCGCIKRQKTQNIIRAIDRVGERFGKLVITEIVGRIDSGKSKVTICKAACDCGVEKEYRLGNLVNGSTVTCGSCTDDKRIIGAPARIVYREYYHGAKKRNIPFELTESQFSELIEHPCHYCGVEPKVIRTSIAHNGVDRKNSNLGYVYENCVPCCKTCNFAKNDMPYDEFIEYLKRVADKWS